MAEALRLDDQFSIRTETERSVTPLRVLKHGDSFAVFDPHGDIVPTEAGEHGFYHAGTRFLSRLELLLGSRQPMLLSSTIGDDNSVFTADLTNPDLVRDGRVVVGHGIVHIFRSRVLWNGSCLERVRVSNHALHPIEVPIAVRFDADFADVFEVRGMHRGERGRRLPDSAGARSVLRYRGLDGVERHTIVHSIGGVDRAADGLFGFELRLEPQERADIEIAVSCGLNGRTEEAPRFDDLLGAVRSRAREHRRDCMVLTSNEAFNHWVQRSSADLRMMITETPHGPYPYAGIPWYSTPFGRDGIITALELLWAWPDIARGVLAFLADTQATAIDDARDAQPGKILHEMRDGEMAALGEIPFGRYYGTADATPLFVMLADAYFERTRDEAFLHRLWPHVLAALGWMAEYGDVDGDGFIEYSRRSATGLVQQGWKDSSDSIFHADGMLAEAPIAVCEIQGYAYAAWSGAARLALALGDEESALRWQQRAHRLRADFDEAFWCPELGTYALALDARKRPCRVRSSNAGHCLFTGVARPDRARVIADTLLSELSFSGWGIRTIAAGESRYNPMSYHNGSVWPHDNAIAAAGLARYGFTHAATRVANAMFDLSQGVDLNRLPELICGFHRRGVECPTLYPVACAPQAWAAGALYLLISACLGLRIDTAARRVSFARAALPDGLEWMRVSNLIVGDARVDLLLSRHTNDLSINVLRREGDVEILAIK